jgi:hypothetical protein
LYGLSVRSSLPLPGARTREAADVILASWRTVPTGPAAGGRGWFACHRLPDDSTYLRWRGLAEFVVSGDGRRIAWRRSLGASHEAFCTYLLSQVLSFSLLARGREPLHASAVAVPGGVIGFLGGCGSGKSSLTAAFLRAGYPLVTDDLLVLRPRRNGYAAEPGVARIKLYPRVARRVLGGQPAGTPMSPGTAKLVFAVPRAMAVRRPLPLHTLYVLARGRSVRVLPVSPGAACLEILRDAFNTVWLDRPRLARQFRFARRLAGRVRVRRISYPRRLTALDEVCEAILRDCAQSPTAEIRLG